MADFKEINNEIDDEINTNGVKGITGAELNKVLRDMITEVDKEKADTLPVGAVFGGWVAPADEIPFGDDHRYFYLAKQQGNYSNFGIILDNDFSLWMFIYDGKRWSSAYIATTVNGLSDEFLAKRSLYSALGYKHFSMSRSYEENEYVTYDGKLYFFIKSHSGEWDSEDVIEVNLADIVTDLLHAVFDEN